MEIKIEEYKGEFLFQVEEVPQEDQQETKGKIKNCRYPFNVEFKIRRKDVYKYGKKAFNGAGIYLITFNDPDKYNEEIIYIGKYMPYGRGNVITDRWIKHIATITNRGHRVGGFGNEYIRNKENPKYPTLRVIDKNDEHIDEIFLLIEKAGRIQDTGCSTSVKRLEFATDKWKTFKGSIENFREGVLPKFKFLYMQLNGYKKDELNVESPSVKVKEYYENLASLVETYLLWKYNPVCNSNEGLKEMDGLTSSKIETEINSFLEKLN